jgi:hypothetical protein
VRVGGLWKYLFRAVDKHGQLIDSCCRTGGTPEPLIASCARL